MVSMVSSRTDAVLATRAFFDKLPAALRHLSVPFQYTGHTTFVLDTCILPALHYQ
jgi:hypothetical protein